MIIRTTRASAWGYSATDFRFGVMPCWVRPSPFDQRPRYPFLEFRLGHNDPRSRWIERIDR